MLLPLLRPQLLLEWSGWGGGERRLLVHAIRSGFVCRAIRRDDRSSEALLERCRLWGCRMMVRCAERVHGEMTCTTVRDVTYGSGRTVSGEFGVLR